MAFLSDDGRVDLEVFGTMTRSIRITIQSVEPATVSATPGQLVDRFVYQVLAEDCAGGAIANLPAEVNLGFSYSDADAAGLNEQNFAIARLDNAANEWRPTAKQAADPGANYVSSTITEMGLYAVYQR